MRYEYSVHDVDLDSHVYSVPTGTVIIDEEVLSGRLFIRLSDTDLDKIRRFVGNGSTFVVNNEKQEKMKVVGIKELFRLINSLVEKDDFCNYQFHKLFSTSHNKKLVLKDSSIIYDLFNPDLNKEMLEKAKKISIKLDKDFNGSI